MRTFWRIEVDCPECEGTGLVLARHCWERDCPACDGSGVEVYDEPGGIYETSDEVIIDYPNARHVCLEALT